MNDVELCETCGLAFCLNCAPTALTQCEGDGNLECEECQADCPPCRAAMREDHAADVNIDNVLEGPW